MKLDAAGHVLFHEATSGYDSSLFADNFQMYINAGSPSLLDEENVEPYNRGAHVGRRSALLMRI